MKITLGIMILMLLASCAKAPECKFAGTYNSEANAGCLLVDNRKVLLIEGKNGKLSLPGGGKAKGEAPQCTAERETWEESGIEVTAGDKIISFDNGFQLFKCSMVGEQVKDGSERPWRFEVKAVHWLGKDDFEGKEWRFPEQVEFIKSQLDE